jgi:hypothetical protein
MRGEEPPSLKNKGEQWTREWVAFEGVLSKMPERLRYCYRAEDIKDAVKRDSHHKCVYCESFIEHVYPGAVDHILPISKCRELAATWTNLAFVCDVCNREKGSYMDAELPLLDPFRDDPKIHLIFFGPTVRHRPGSPRGEVTVKTLKLGRAGLFERGQERIDQLATLLDKLLAMPDGPRKDIVKQEIENELSADRPYAAISRAYVEAAMAEATDQGAS